MKMQSEIKNELLELLKYETSSIRSRFEKDSSEDEDDNIRQLIPIKRPPQRFYYHPRKGWISCQEKRFFKLNACNRLIKHQVLMFHKLDTFVIKPKTKNKMDLSPKSFQIESGFEPKKNALEIYFDLQKHRPGNRKRYKE